MSNPTRAAAATACAAWSVLLMAAVAFGGDSAASPGLGAGTLTPPWDVGAHPGPWPVTLALALAVLLGAAAVGLGLLEVRRGARPHPRRVAVLAGVAVAVLVCVPPLGSADHLSYAAYGRIAASGDNPYTVPPIEWRGGTDPVAGAVQPPWQRTPSIYGPVATAVQAATAIGGRAAGPGGALRLTIWLWQLIAGACFLLTALVLDRLTRADPAARARAAVLWTLNPLLLGQLVLGAHLDVLAAAAALLGLALSGEGNRWRWLAGGAALGVAAGVKAPYALAGLAVCWGLRAAGREGWRRAGWGALGALAVLVPAHLWTGPHTYDQVDAASKFVSFATPWRLLVDHLGARPVVRPAAVLLAVVLAALLARRFTRPASAAAPEAETPCGATASAPPADPVLRSAATATVVLGAAWVLSVPYALPWYDVMVWAFLPLVAGHPVLDGALLLRLAALALAYVPGRVVGLGPDVERVTLGFRRDVAPWLVLLALSAVVAWTLAGRPRPPRPAGGPRPAPAPGR
jgi:hypothetical protein